MNDLKYQLENRNFGWKERTESMVAKMNAIFHK